MQQVPFVDLGIQTRQVEKLVREGWQSLLESSAFILGNEVGLFEEEFARFCGVNGCVGVGNGTDAIELALRAACGLRRGDEVIVPTNSFIATALAVVRTGAQPVFVDCDPVNFLIDVDQVADRITKKTRAIIPVHLYGQVAPVDQLEMVLPVEHVVIVEDAAQSQGATRWGKRAGGLGTIAATSFYPGKNLGAFGDGGAVLTNSSELMGRVQALRNYGSQIKYEHSELGFNSRLDSIQAVVLRAKLAHLDSWNSQRRRAADLYGELLKDIDGLVLPSVLAGNEHIWHLYVVRIQNRDNVAKKLNENHVQTGVHYPTPIHLQRAFQFLGHQPGDFPVSESLSGEILSLPMFPGIEEEQQQQVADSLRKALV
jgi:dTDP-4-amino-4,6-dideoxygalactose transaminase